jgi:hypothetical protein
MGDPRLSGAGEGKRIRVRHRPVLHDPFAGLEMPPDVRIKDIASCHGK